MKPMMAFEFMSHSISTNDVSCYKAWKLFRSDDGIWCPLQQVGKIINGHQDLFVAISAHRCDLANYFDSLGGVSVYGYDGGMC